MDIKRAEELHQRATGEVPAQDDKGNWRDSVEVGNEVLAGLDARKEIEARTLPAWAILILAVEALEAQGLLLDCLETVCVGLPPTDREAADNFIEQIAASGRKALAGWREL